MVTSRNGGKELRRSRTTTPDLRELTPTKLPRSGLVQRIALLLRATRRRGESHAHTQRCASQAHKHKFLQSERARQQQARVMPLLRMRSRSRIRDCSGNAEPDAVTCLAWKVSSITTVRGPDGEPFVRE